MMIQISTKLYKDTLHHDISYPNQYVDYSSHFNETGNMHWQPLTGPEKVVKEIINLRGILGQYHFNFM